MSSYSSTKQQTEKHLQLWIYFLPLVGTIPAAWTLYQTRELDSRDCQSNPLADYAGLQQQKKASRQAINIALVWLCSYILFSYGATSATEIISFRFLFANAITTTGYFITCTFLMSRLGKKRLFSAD
ncbi:MAG: hypothetical protein AAFO95_20240 [Cyanobacteria bacterium J06600_6]